MRVIGRHILGPPDNGILRRGEDEEIRVLKQKGSLLKEDRLQAPGGQRLRPVGIETAHPHLRLAVHVTGKGSGRLFCPRSGKPEEPGQGQQEGQKHRPQEQISGRILRINQKSIKQVDKKAGGQEKQEPARRLPAARPQQLRRPGVLRGVHPARRRHQQGLGRIGRRSRRRISIAGRGVRRSRLPAIPRGLHIPITPFRQTLRGAQAAARCLLPMSVHHPAELFHIRDTPFRHPDKHMAVIKFNAVLFFHCVLKGNPRDPGFRPLPRRGCHQTALCKGNADGQRLRAHLQRLPPGRGIWAPRYSAKTWRASQSQTPPGQPVSPIPGRTGCPTPRDTPLYTGSILR